MYDTVVLDGVIADVGLTDDVIVARGVRDLNGTVIVLKVTFVLMAISIGPISKAVVADFPTYATDRNSGEGDNVIYVVSFRHVYYRNFDDYFGI